MKTVVAFLGTCLTAVILPYWTSSFSSASSSANFPGWMSEWRGAPLKRLPLSWREEKFAEDFPGQVAQFTDGKMRMLVRYTASPTRKLLSAEECFRSIGFRVQPLLEEVDERGERWARLVVSSAHERWEVRERIASETGEAWTEPSSWYWAAAYGRAKGPWWAITILEPVARP